MSHTKNFYIYSSASSGERYYTDGYGDDMGTRLDSVDSLTFESGDYLYFGGSQNVYHYVFDSMSGFGTGGNTTIDYSDLNFQWYLGDSTQVGFGSEYLYLDSSYDLSQGVYLNVSVDGSSYGYSSYTLDQGSFYTDSMLMESVDFSNNALGVDSTNPLMSSSNGGASSSLYLENDTVTDIQSSFDVNSSDHLAGQTIVETILFVLMELSV